MQLRRVDVAGVRRATEHVQRHEIGGRQDLVDSAGKGEQPRGSAVKATRRSSSCAELSVTCCPRPAMRSAEGL